jgi:hypothetical protein
MSSSSLTETKANLMLAERLLRDVERDLNDATPSHSNDIDAWLSTGIQEATNDCKVLSAKVRALIGQI